jgi:hypothetical protein
MGQASTHSAQPGRKRCKLNVVAPPETCGVTEQALEPPSRHLPSLKNIANK